MKSGSCILFFLVFIIACSVAPTPSSNPQNIDLPTSTFEVAVFEYPDQEQWFTEYFDQGMPTNWIASPGWTAGQGSILSIQREQTFRVPSEWYDLEIYARLQRGAEGWSSIGFRNKNDNYYQLSFDQNQLILGRHSADQYHGQQLWRYEIVATPGWHEVVISVVGGNILVTWDGVAVIDYTDEDPIISGDIFMQNWDNSLYELDVLRVSPPTRAMADESSAILSTMTVSATATVKSSIVMATDTAAVKPSTTKATDTAAVLINPQGTKTPTITPTTSSNPRGGCAVTFDLGVGSTYLSARGSLMMTVVNNGPSAYSGQLYTTCTIWYDEVPSPVGIGSSDLFSLVLEPGQTTELETSCSLDNSMGPLIGGTTSIQESACDPNPTNNYSNF